ncbi:hypothetical protein KR018_002355 [Drosophila ironensis]|nr:hypothetical protein KR018_002355 [Drosophila ironensis]
MLVKLLLLFTCLSFGIAAKKSPLHVFTNSRHDYGSARVILTKETLNNDWFTTKVTANEQILVDYFQTNTSETKEPLLWYRTKNLSQTLNFNDIYINKKLPYYECYFHISRVNLFSNGLYKIVAVITTKGVYGNEEMASTSTLVKTSMPISCEPEIRMRQCQDSNRPLHYETSKVIVLRAVFFTHCPNDDLIQFYWTLYDSTETVHCLMIGQYFIYLMYVQSTGNRVIIPAFTQPNNQTLRVILLIRSVFDPLRTATTKQTIVFSSSRRLINVNIACVSNCNGNKYTLQFPIHLKGQCLRCRSKKVTKWQWRVESSLVEGASNRLIFDVKEKKKRLQSMHLDVEAVSRHRPEKIYHGTTWIVLEKNMGPADTTCSIKPREGTAHQTLFQLHCKQSQARFKPLRFCVGVENFLIDDCKTDEEISIRLPPTEQIIICDNFYVCADVTVAVDVRRLEIKDDEETINKYLTKVRFWLQYANWQRAFLILYQLTKLVNTMPRLISFIDTLSVYEPQTTVQLAHLVRLTKRIVLSVEPLDDMEAKLIARMLHKISSTFKLIIDCNELNTLMDNYYETMVSELCDILNKFNAEWEYVPKSQCRAESESCLNIGNFRKQQEQMATLRPQGLEHINNWLHAYWKLSRCLFYMGMGNARRLHPEEGPKLFERSTFNMRFESFDLDQERTIEFESADAMHTLVFTDNLLQEFRRKLQADEILISVRSHKLTPYWWYPEQESTTQVLVVNAYTATAIWQKTQEIVEPFQYISKLKMNYSAEDVISEETILRRKQRDMEFDDPEEDVENVISDNVLNTFEVRMFRTEIYGHSILAITFTQAEIDFDVLLRMSDAPKLEDMNDVESTCRVNSGLVQPLTLLIRNRCKQILPVYVYIRAANASEPWDKYADDGAYFTFVTEIRSCRIWNYARPEPSWQNFACMPEMNISTYFGIHCKCNYVSDFDADATPIVIVPMNLKCHIDHPTVGYNYQMITFYAFITVAAGLYLFFNMQEISVKDKRLYVEMYPSREACYSGDLAIRLTFGGRYNAGSSGNIMFTLKSGFQVSQLILYQDPNTRSFQRNTTISFRIPRQLVSLPCELSLQHDGTGIYPHFFVRSVLLTDMVTEETQTFRIHQWVRTSGMNTTEKKVFFRSEPGYKAGAFANTWRQRFSLAMEGYMGNWYLFQPVIGPWRYGITENSFCRWERGCIYISKLFITLTIVVIFFGASIPIACDPRPRQYNDFDVIIWLCLVCSLVNCVVQTLMEMFCKFIEVTDFL